MSTSLLVRANEKLKRIAVAGKNAKILQKQEVAVAVGGMTQLSTAPQAAFVDIKLGKDGNQAKVLNVVPINALIGLPFGVAAFFLTKYPVLAAALAGEGFGMVNNALYRLILDVHAKHVADAAAAGTTPPAGS